MDVERLHERILKPSGARQTGRTYAALVGAIQRADFAVKRVYFVTAVMRDVQWLRPMIESICKDLGFSCRWKDHKTALIDEMELVVGPALSPAFKAMVDRWQVVEDHYAVARRVWSP